MQPEKPCGVDGCPNDATHWMYGNMLRCDDHGKRTESAKDAPSCNDKTCCCPDRVEIYARALYEDYRVESWPTWDRLDEDYRAGTRDKWREKAKAFMERVGVAFV